MIKTIGKVLIASVVALGIFYTSQSTAEASSSNEDMIKISDSISSNKTINEIEEILTEHMKKNNLNYTLGSNEYIDYLMGILLEDKDEILKEYRDYDSIVL